MPPWLKQSLLCPDGPRPVRLTRLALTLALVTVFGAVLGAPVWAQKHTVLGPNDPDPYTDLRSGWGWYQQGLGIQARRLPGEVRTTLRQFGPNKQYEVYAYLDTDFSLIVAVFFPTLCELGEAISVGERDKNGRRKAMVCSDDGNYMVHTAYWQRDGRKGEFNQLWQGDLDGFEFAVDFSQWDFAPLVQEIENAQ
jgi:hypothetical protein